MPPLLYLLATGNLVIGTGAFLLTGLLQPVASALGTSVAMTGQTMTAYALANALLAPLLLVATGRWSRRAALQMALVLFALGLLLCAVSEGLATLLAGRVLMGAAAVFTPISASIAVALVAPAQQGKALSLTFLGMSMSYVVGLPLGAWLGTRYGWRTPVFGLAAIVGLMIVLVGAWVPRANRAPGASFSGLGSLLRRPEVIRSLALTLLYFCAIFSVFAYSGPVLQALNPMSPEKLSATLMIFGLAGMAGTLSGGWASDRFGPIRTLRVQLLALTSMMLLVPLTQGRYPLMVAVFIVWGIAGFGMMSPTQARLVNISPRQAPMLFSLNSSMLYAGTALGAAVGGISSAAFGFSNLAWAGAGFAVLGAFTLVSAKR